MGKLLNHLFYRADGKNSMQYPSLGNEKWNKEHSRAT
jgi:hypothetical protein